MAMGTQKRCNALKNVPIHQINQIIHDQIIYSMKRTIPTLITVWLLCLASIQTMAQERVVRGTVVDPSGTPIPGASIILKGTISGTVTGAEGTFSLSVDAN